MSEEGGEPVANKRPRLPGCHPALRRVVRDGEGREGASLRRGGRRRHRCRAVLLIARGVREREEDLCICLLSARNQKPPTNNAAKALAARGRWHVYGCGSKFWRIGRGGQERGLESIWCVCQPCAWRGRTIPSSSFCASSLSRLCPDIFHRKLPDRMSGETAHDLVGRDCVEEEHWGSAKEHYVGVKGGFET